MNGNLLVIREAFGRVVYSHKTHEKACEIASSYSSLIKWINIVLTAVTASSIIAVIITDQTALKYITGIFSLLTLGFTLFQLSFNPDEEASKHRQIAKEIWFIRERYENLISDIMNKIIDTNEAVKRRDELIEQVGNIYKYAPQTSSKAYAKAQKALKYKEDMTFSNAEINAFLPKNLHVR